MNRNYGLIWLKAALLGALMAGGLLLLINTLRPPRQVEEQNNDTEILYEVKSVLDGDTFTIDYGGKETSVRIIGVNTPETIDPRTMVECFGEEASDYLKSLLTSKKVRIESDSSIADRDKYDRLLRYVYLDGEDVGYKIISKGYGYEYTYDVPYSKQTLYKNAQNEADKNGVGLWADGVCVEDNNTTEAASDSQNNNDSANANAPANVINDNQQNCDIKGNINYSGEKIYHVPGQEYYNETKIDVERGERWFCSEEEAQAAGWRKSKV